MFILNAVVLYILFSIFSNLPSSEYRYKIWGVLFATIIIAIPFGIFLQNFIIDIFIVQLIFIPIQVSVVWILSVFWLKISRIAATKIALGFLTYFLVLIIGSILMA
jgi:hypothetical protein